jgi:hypothetical protein
MIIIVKLWNENKEAQMIQKPLTLFYYLKQNNTKLPLHITTLVAGKEVNL